MRNRWNKILLLFMVPILLNAFGCSDKPRADTSSQSSQQPQAQSNATSSGNESDYNASIPAFKGTVIYGKSPLITIQNDKWEQAKQDFESEYPYLQSTMKNINSSDFAVTDNWQGILNNEPFLLNVYSYQAQFLLVVSKYGNNPAKIKIFLSGPKSVFAFYGDCAWLMQGTKGAGTSLKISTDELDESSSQTVNLNLKFERLFTKLSTIQSEKRLAGTKLQIEGYNLLVVHDMAIVVIDK